MIKKKYFWVLFCFTFFHQPTYPTQNDCDVFLNQILVPQCKNNCSHNACFGKTFFSVRPQDSNSAIRLSEIAQEEHRYYHHFLKWGFNLNVGGQRTFVKGDDNLLSRWFLFNGTSNITVGVPSDTLSFDVDGRQLGLTTSNQSAGLIGNLSLDPSITHIITRGDFWFDLNTLIKNLWFRTNFTLVRSERKLGICSTTLNALQTGTYDKGVYTINCLTSPVQYKSITEAFIGDSPIGDIPALGYGKFFCDTLSKTRLASIRFDLGFDVIRYDRYFLNISGCLIAPTGNRPRAIHIFEPVDGANKSWQLGGEITGYYNFLNPEDGIVALYGDATLTHLFKSKQNRVFSLKNNGAGSQYLLLKEFDLSVGVVTAGERAANIFNGQTHIGAAVMFDGSLMLHFSRGEQFFVDIGYNFWIRSKETISNTISFKNFEKDSVGVKGNFTLSKVDAVSGLCIGNLTTASSSTIGKPGAADSTSQTLDACDVDFCSALHPTAFSNKIFTTLGYLKKNQTPYPNIYIALEAEAEFGQKNRALNQWAVNMIIGIAL